MKSMSSPSAASALSRRRFLGRAARLGAVGLALPQIVPTGIIAAPGRPGPNEQIGIGGIGVGRQGGGDVNYTARLPLARMVAMADVNLPRAREIAKPFEAAVYQDYRQLLERKDVDAIITATPEQWRGRICIHACQAGKDLYVEKPMSLTIHEGRQIARAVRKYGRVFQTGSQQRSMSENHKGCTLIRNGRLGRIKKVIAHNYPTPWECRLPAQSLPDELDWEMWCGPAPLVPYHQDLQAPRANPGWLSFRPFSGGEMTGWGSHGFDQVQWALGMDETGPLEVWTDGPALQPPIYDKSEPKTRGDVICSAPKVFFRYPGDIIMELGEGPMGGAVFVGEKGTLTIDRAKVVSDPEELAYEKTDDLPVQLYKSRNHQQNWLDCIKSREKPIADVEIGHRSATICHLGNIARWLGRKLEWDPINEVFVNDPEANELLDRPRRRGYELPEV
ncbi:MAG: Gfo/Idh/MocA family oxidoreductase [Verrucomicrobiales bacterium]|nr:Gfo/Idh/MocA family oxidoreductase [Verrucomicrobiales bacterium]MCP5525412.1 Gfo/Idh/MocA family oxidoreductase [Verrucomicrobiales bacterium]